MKDAVILRRRLTGKFCPNTVFLRYQDRPFGNRTDEYHTSHSSPLTNANSPRAPFYRHRFSNQCCSCVGALASCNFCPCPPHSFRTGHKFTKFLSPLAVLCENSQTCGACVRSMGAKTSGNQPLAAIKATRVVKQHGRAGRRLTSHFAPSSVQDNGAIRTHQGPVPLHTERP